MRLPLSRSIQLLLSFLFHFDSRFVSVNARTTYFSPQDVAVKYSPTEAWGSAGGETVRAIQEGAKLEIRFAGEQITLFGQTSSNVQYSIELDNQSFPSSSFEPSNSASPSRLFQASNLERDEEHRLELTVENGGTFVLNRIAIAFSSSNDNTPALLSIGSTSATTLSTSSIQASILASPSSAANNSLDNRPYSSSPSSSVGVVVGATLGSLAAFALLIALILCLRRRRSSSPSSNNLAHNVSPYINQETGNRRSFIPTAFQRRSSSVLPWSSTPRTPLSPSPIFLNPINGGIGSSPRQPESSSSPSTPVIVGSQTWQAKLTRAASWRRKVERLEETRKFYGVGKGGNGNMPELRGPPPAVPLPRPPGATRDGPREMEERWRSEGPRLEVKKQERRRSYSPDLSVSPYLIATPQDSDQGHEVEERVQHAYGQAISTNDVSSIRVVSPTSPSPSSSMQHLRKRSNPISPSSSSSRFSSSAIARPFPLPTSPHSTLHQNPFTLTHSLTDSDASRSSLENAKITRAQTRSIGAVGASLSNSNLDASRSTPLRSSSMRSMVDTVRAGPGENVRMLGEGQVMVERKPSLTRIVNGRVATNAEIGREGRHRSVAGLIEGVADVANNEAGGMTRRRREEPELPSEEDRPDYWIKRDVIPKYEVEKGDPRLRK